MNRIDTLKHVWTEAFEEARETKGFARLLAGKFTTEHYSSLMRQIYFYTRESPQLNSLAALFLRGAKRRFARLLLDHAREELGHDQLALHDLRALDHDISSVPAQFANPATTALVAFVIYTTEHKSPLFFLGYLFFLEFLPTMAGKDLANGLESAGIPVAAQGFLRAHTAIDVGHNRLMEQYVDGLVTSDADEQIVSYSIRSTAYLYSQLIAEAFQDVDRQRSFGQDPCEGS